MARSTLLPRIVCPQILWAASSPRRRSAIDSRLPMQNMLTFQWKWQCGKTHRVLQNGMWFIVGFTTPVANEELNHTGELARDNMMCLAYSMQHAYIYIYIYTYIYRIYCICHYFHPLDNSCPHATWKMTRKHVCCPHIQDHHGQITAPLFGRTT